MDDAVDSMETDSNNGIRTIARGAGIVFAGTIAGVVLKYAFELYLARSLGPDLFGVFFLGFTIFRILERVSVFGLHNGVIRYVSIFLGSGDKQRLKGTILLSILAVSIISFIISAVVVPLSGLISDKIFNDPRLEPVLIIFTLVLLFNAISEMMVNSTQGFKIMRYKTIVRMLFEPAFRLVLAAVFVMLGWSLLGAVSAYALSLAAGLLLSFIFLKRTFPDLTNRQKVFKFEAKKILGFSWPLAFVGFFNVVMFQINTIMLGYFSTSQDIGIFGAVQRTSFAIQIIQASFNPIFAPIVADLFNRRKFSELESYFKIITNWVFMISFPLFIFLMVFPRELLNVWGSGYMAGWPSLMIISISMIINCSLGPVKNMIMMTGRSRLNLLNDGLSFLLAVVLNIILIPRYGVLGASISFASAVFVVNIMGFIEVYLILKIHPYKRSILKPMTAGVMIFAAIFMIKRYIFAGSIGIIWLIILMLLSLGLYAGLLILFRLNQEDRVVLAMIARRLRGRKSPL